jgi:hypothetical protein
MIGSIHIVPRGDTWGVLREGDDGDISSYMTHTDALEVGRAIARSERTELVIHDTDGGVRGVDFYGREPAHHDVH